MAKSRNELGLLGVALMVLQTGAVWGAEVLSEPLYPNAVAMCLEGCEEESDEHLLVAGTNATATVFIEDCRTEWTEWKKVIDGVGGVGGRFRHTIRGIAVKGVPAAEIDLSSIVVYAEGGPVEMPQATLGKKISPALEDIFIIPGDENYVAFAGPTSCMVPGYEQYANHACYKVEIVLPKGSGFHGKYFWTAHVLFDFEYEDYSYSKDGKKTLVDQGSIYSQQIPGAETSWRDVRDSLLLMNPDDKRSWVFFAKDEKDYKDAHGREISNWFTYWGVDGAVPQLLSARYETVPSYESLLTQGGEYAIEFGGKGSGWGKYENGKVELYEIAGDAHYYAVKREDGRYYERAKDPNMPSHIKKFWDPKSFGIYTAANVIAHESEHQRLEEEYFLEIGDEYAQYLRDARNGTYQNNDVAKKIKNEYDSDMEYEVLEEFFWGLKKTYKVKMGKYKVNNEEKERIMSDFLTDEMENGKYASYGLSCQKLDTYELGRYKGSEYAYYGDNEYLAMEAGYDAVHSKCQVHEECDWAFPGHQSYLPPVYQACYAPPVRSESRRMMVRKSLETKGEAASQPANSMTCISVTHELIAARIGPKYRRIDYDFRFDVEGTNRVEIIGYLSDLNSNVVAKAAVRQEFTPSNASCTLSFDGQEIHSYKKDGPYMLLGLVFREYDDMDCYFHSAVSGLNLPHVEVSYADFVRADMSFMQGAVEESVSPEGLNFGLYIEAQKQGRCVCFATLSSADGEVIGTESVPVECVAGTNRLDVLFSADRICRAARNGPYVLTDVKLQRGLNKEDEVDEPYETKMTDFATYFGFEVEEPVLSETVGSYTYYYRVVAGGAVIERHEDFWGFELPVVAVDPAPEGALVIPGVLGGFPVVEIGEWAFRECTGLTAVTIPNSVRRIGDSAFEDCEALTNATFEGDAPRVDDYAFDGVNASFAVTAYEGTVGWNDGIWAELKVQTVPRRAILDGHYVVMFKTDGDLTPFSSFEWKADQVYALPPCTLTPPAGKRFAGWACSNGRRYDDGMLVFDLAKPGETVTMTAVWE